MKRNLTYKVIVVGLMAAIVFVCTYFIRIEIPTPAGLTNIKTGNIVCLLSGLLFGGVMGGLSAGIGSMLFDLMNPAYAPSAPFTLVFFFLMGFLCGVISHMHGNEGKKLGLNITGAVVGAFSYVILNISKSIIVLMLAGSEFWPALIANSTKILVSSINAVIAIVVSVIIAVPLRKALDKTGFTNKLK